MGRNAVNFQLKLSKQIKKKNETKKKKKLATDKIKII